jgi:hypothetical protein
MKCFRILNWVPCFLVWLSLTIHIQLYSQDWMSILANDRQVVIDLTAKINPKETYVLEGRQAGIYQVLGAYQRPGSYQEFAQRYQYFVETFPDMIFNVKQEGVLKGIWEDNSNASQWEDLGAMNDRLLTAAFGFTLIVNRQLISSVDSLRLRLKREVLSTMPLHIPSINDQACAPILRFLKANEDHPFASWQCDFQNDILGFKVFRSIEFMNQWEVINADRSISIDADTMIFIMQDTTMSLPGLYHYAIRCIDLAGNEGPLSDLVRLPKFNGVDIPSAVVEAKGNKEDRLIKLTWEIDQSWRVTSIDILRRRMDWDEFEHLATVGAEVRQFDDPVDDVREVYIYQLVLNDIALDHPIKTIPVFSLSTVEEPAFANVVLDFESDSTGAKLFIKVEEHLYLQGMYLVRGFDEYTPFEIVSDFIPFTGDSLIVWKDADQRLEGDKLYGYSLLLVSDGFVQSPISDTVFIYNLRNINIPEPIITRARLFNGNGHIFWDISMFEETKVDSFIIYRCSGDKFDLNTATSTKVSVDQSLWPLQETDEGHTYAIQAVHWSGKKGPISRAVTIRAFKDSPEPPIGLYMIKNTPYPHFGWPEMKDKRIKQLGIYRSTQEEGATLIATVETSRVEYEDTSALTDKTYFYWILPISHDNLPIEPSDKLLISYE